MAKFKMRLKVQGLELEVEGERQDIPLITAAVSKQFSSLVEPTNVIVEAPPKHVGNGSGVIIDVDGARKPGRRPRGTRPPAESAAPVEFRHNSGTLGSPVQNWSVLQKAIWLLYVLQTITGNKEYSAAQLVATYNQQFKAAGKFHPPLLSRELSKAKVLSPAPIGEDKDMWYLTAEGERQAKELVGQALGQ
jgi:hypothetical protein